VGDCLLCYAEVERMDTAQRRVVLVRHTVRIEELVA
jgi:hypothetical protein